MKRLAEHFVDELMAHAVDDERVWLLDGDLADSYGATAFADRFPDRFVMAGIAEQNMVSVAAGMASCGARPFVFSFAAFLAYRAADQIRVGLVQSRLPVTLVASHAGGCSGRNGRSHSATGDIALMASLAGIEVWAPADRHDVMAAVAAARSGDVPLYCRTPRDALADLAVPPGPIRIAPGGGDTLILACGLATHWALEAQALLASEGISCDVASVARLCPLPLGIDTLLAEPRTVIVIEDHMRTGGLADLVAARTGRVPDLWFGWHDHPPGGDTCAVRRWGGLDAATIAGAVRDRLRR